MPYRSDRDHYDIRNDRYDLGRAATARRAGSTSRDRRPSGNGGRRVHDDYAAPATQLYAGPSSRKKRGILLIVLAAIGSALAFIGKGIGKGAVALWNKSKAASAVVAVALLLVIGACVDGILTSGRIYQGVSVGVVDLSNKTIDEARDAVNAEYMGRLFDTQTFVFQDEASMDSVVMDPAAIDLDKLTTLVENEESQDVHTIWLADAITLGAELPTDEIVSNAYEVGRATGPFDRLGALIMGYVIEPYASYNQVMLDSMINDIKTSTGDPLVNWGVAIADGVASVTEGHDGYELDKDSFVAGLDYEFFVEQGDVHAWVADVPFSEVSIDQAAAQSTCDAVNAALQSGASFVYDSTNLPVDAAVMGGWIATSVEKHGDGFALEPSIDPTVATTSIVQLLNPGSASYDVDVSIYYDEDDELTVKPSHSVVIPSTETALEELDESLFAHYRNTGQFAIEGTQYDIPISSEDYDGTFTVEDALSYGIIEVFSSFTTEYSTKASNANRIFNIHLAADMLDDTIVDAYGGTWSFNDIVGDTTEDAGFREAGSIIEDERTDAIGGGICQVATTIYNAVYESGLPINERHNHTLYMSAYPDGRDAAVSYPLLDLVWENDTASDILVTTSYTESSVTANLVGVNPQYTVETVKGEWQKGERYTTKVEIDDNIAEGTYIVDTNGIDGQTIEVKRTVKDANGAILREKTFVSVYSPVNQLIKAGPNSDTAEIMEKFERKDTAGRSTSSNGSGSSSSSSSASSGGSGSGPSGSSGSSGATSGT